MKIYIGSDHAGYKLKEILKKYIEDELKLEIIDKGAFSLDKDDDYPDFIIPVAKAVSFNKDSFGIIIGGSGEGEAMCANKIKGIRSALYYGGTAIQKDVDGNELNIVASTRRHNNANILSLGARFMTENEAKKAVKIFIQAPFLAETRHLRRIEKINKIEE